MLNQSKSDTILSLVCGVSLFGCNGIDNVLPQPEQAPPIDTTPPVITLQGQATVQHEAATDYTDAGATATDDIDGDISANVTVTGSVDTGNVGTYTLTYNVSDARGNNAATVTRTVNVVDTTPPVITINGDASQTIEVNTSFTDLGATASDTLDGDITSAIAATSSVNTLVVGNYQIQYNVSDANGNAAATVTRDVAVVDTTAPTVVSFTPKSDAIDVATNVNVEVVFSEAVDSNSLSGNAFSLIDDNANSVDGTLDLDNSGTSISFQPNNDLLPATTYTVTLSTDITDEYANMLSQAVTWSFTTLAETTSNLPVLINTQGRPANKPNIAVNSAGEAAAVWRQGGDLFVNMYEPENGWVGDVNVTPDGNVAPREEVKIVNNDNGDIVLAWINDTGENAKTTVGIRRYTKANGWADITIFENRDGIVNKVDVDMDEDGNIFAIWDFQGNNDNLPGVYVKRYNANTGEWGNTDILVENENTGFANVSVAMNSNNQAVAVWTVDAVYLHAAEYILDVNNTGNENEYEWTSPHGIGTGSDQYTLEAPELSMNQDGKTVVVWAQASDQNTSTDIHANYYTADAGWSTAQAIESMHAGEARYPQVDLNQQMAAVVWTEFDGTKYNLYSSVLDQQNQWQSPMLVQQTQFNTGNSNDGGARVSISSANMVTVAWEQKVIVEASNTVENRIFMNRFDATQMPQTASAFALEQITPTNEAYFPALGVAADGTAIVVSQRLSNNLDIQAHNVP